MKFHPFDAMSASYSLALAIYKKIDIDQVKMLEEVLVNGHNPHGSIGYVYEFFHDHDAQRAFAEVVDAEWRSRMANDDPTARFEYLDTCNAHNLACRTLGGIYFMATDDYTDPSQHDTVLSDVIFDYQKQVFDRLVGTHRSMLAYNIMSALSLDGLYAALCAADEYCAKTGTEMQAIADVTSLPIFGGDEPSDTTAIFSWDKDRVLAAEGKWYLVPRSKL